MKWEVQLYVSGNTFKEEVVARNYQDAKETAQARNPKARVIAANPKTQYRMKKTNGLGMFLMTVLTQMTFVGFLVILCLLLA